MHWVNKALSWFHLRLNRTRRIPPEFMRAYRRDLAALKRDPAGYTVLEDLVCEVGDHPQDYVEHECGFAARHLARLDPAKILDVGSYRQFILGVLSHRRVTTVDVRERAPAWSNEIVVTGDVKNLKLPDGEFDAVVSLCALEHFGLGRYGDPFDVHADEKAFAEMVRVLKPGGRLIFTTTLSRAPSCVVFNAHRIYDLGRIRGLCAGLEMEEEKYYSHKQGFCSLEEITAEPGFWDVYCGCWKNK